jgi:glycosyltransferase involved in cell wall biosynthesis
MHTSLHLGIGHYGIGFKDGVNTVISRNVRALLDIDPALKITLFGKLSNDFSSFIKTGRGKVEFRDVDEFDPESSTSRLVQKSIYEQQVHDYIWQGTNIAEVLVRKLWDMDVIIAENLGIGIDPSVTYAYYLYTQYCYTSKEKKIFFYRFHDFVQQRPVNFSNVKKFFQSRFGVTPNWHGILYPAYPNIRYISINRYDRQRLIEHGIEEKNIFYIPNSVDRSIVPIDDRTDELRKKIIEREKLDPTVKFILYPVRCVRRKNVEEAILLTMFFNYLAEGRSRKTKNSISGRFHLLVSLKPQKGDDAVYAGILEQFVKEHGLPVTIGLDDLVSLEREYDREIPQKIIRYGVGDIYRVSDLVITTSTLEGFGFVYVEPWLLDRAVIGRSIPFVTPDFQSAGMKLGHLYTALIVDRMDFKDIGQENGDPNEALQERLKRVLKLADSEYLDRFIESNETSMLSTLRLFQTQHRQSIIEKNREVVEEVYSQESIGVRLYKAITSQIEELNRNGWE